MNEIVSGVLKLTFGFLANKARSKISEHLNDSDVTDEECRRLIVRELDDIKTKLDGLARKDLLSSLCFLQEGINGLYQSLQQFEPSKSKTESGEKTAMVEVALFEETGPYSQIKEVMSLINAFNSLKIHSTERFGSAMKSFELARENATKAFSNKALSIEDRIQASQVRMMARILEKSEDPDAGVSDCLQYLKQLHDIKAIQEIFSVVIDGGIRSWFSKTKRLSNVSSVYQMNQLLFEFARRYSNLQAVFFHWPGILLRKETYHPLVRDDRLVKRLEESGVKVVFPFPDFTFSNIFPHCCVVNSKREIVAKVHEDFSIQILKPSGEFRILFGVSKPEDASKCDVVAMDIDAEDNLYIITRVRKGKLYRTKLLVFDSNDDKKLQSLLPFRHKFVPVLCMAVHKDKKIAILDAVEQILYIGLYRTNAFKIYDSFHHLDELSRKAYTNVLFLDNNGAKIIVAGNEDCFYIYTENGELERKVLVPEEYGHIDSVTINYVTRSILVKTDWPEICFCSFSETGELMDNLRLTSNPKSSLWIDYTKLISNPHGGLALVDEKQVIFLQV